MGYQFDIVMVNAWPKADLGDWVANGGYVLDLVFSVTGRMARYQDRGLEPAMA
ncbi:hypothetical protein [Acidocella sp.]|uniref:hypothetical protein n=1 Tax=Acidocella sp. TaxID=50710 RepID=UPI003D08991A